VNRREMLRRSLGFGASLTLPSTAIGLLPKPAETSASLKVLADKAGLKLGVQAQKRDLQNPEFVQWVVENFSVVTPGNELKWPRLHPTPDSYAFDDADWMIEFCQIHGLLVHGHNLCWNSPFGNPAWFSSSLTHENASRTLVDYITTVVKRYKGRIESWDVVNEPVVAWSKRPDGLYPGIWLSLLGPGYLDAAFHATQAADPSALRVLNCYYVEQDTPDAIRTRDMTVALLQGMLKRNVPVQAVGIESHLSATIPLGGASFAKFLRQLSDMGLQVLFTELDVDDSEVIGDIAMRDKVVGRVYFDYLVENVPAARAKRVIFWSPGDRGNWLNSMPQAKFHRSDGQPHRPGLLDDSFKDKPAFDSVQAALMKLSVQSKAST
jgi:endo-1,4-beta-xylanase